MLDRIRGHPYDSLCILGQNKVFIGKVLKQEQSLSTSGIIAVATGEGDFAKAEIAISLEMVSLVSRFGFKVLYCCICYERWHNATGWYGAIAQLGERNTGSVEVSGSIPLSSTKRRLMYVSPSSSGLGHRPFTAVTGVRVP